MRNAQPQVGPAKIDYGSPITRGLVVAFDGALPGLNLALRTPIVSLVPTAQVAVRDGLSPLLVTANNTGLSLGADARFDPPAQTIFVVATLSAAGVNGGSCQLFTRDDNTLGRSFTFDINTINSYGFRFYVNGGGTLGNPACAGLDSAKSRCLGHRPVHRTTHSGGAWGRCIDGREH